LRVLDARLIRQSVALEYKRPTIPTPMTRTKPFTILAAAATLLFAAPAFAQKPHHHQNTAQQRDAKMQIHQVASDAIEIRLGPYDLPANTGHDVMPQAPDFIWEVPFDGWLVAYAPSLIDGEGNDIPQKLLHHVAFYNTGRSDFLCPEKEEH